MNWWIFGAAAGAHGGLSVAIGQSEHEQMGAASKILCPNMICFDLGANVGQYALLFSRRAKQVYAFEPMPRNLRYLYELVEINKLKNVTIIPCAVSDKCELDRFESGINCALGKISQDGDQPVIVVSLDKFCQKYKIFPDLIKIDVEGAEMSVLEGGQWVIDNKHPIILLSTHSEKLKEECLAWLENRNYKIVPLDVSETLFLPGANL